MLKGPLALLERHDRPAFEGRSGSERSTEPGSSAKTVASQPVVGYRIRSRTAKKEILVEYGMWYARSADFLQTPLLETFRWLRTIGDTIFAIGMLAMGWFVVGLTTGWSILGRREDAAS